MYSMSWSTSVTVVQRLQIHIDIIMKHALIFHGPNIILPTANTNDILILRG